MVANTDSAASADFVVVCALEVEREAMCKVLGLTDHHRVTRDWRRYWLGPLQGDCGTFTVVVAQLPLVANVAAATSTSLSIQDWNPQAVLLVGIAAAARKSQRLGDVVVGERVSYYELGKFVPGGMLPQPEMISADYRLLNLASTAPKWQGSTRMRRPDGTRAKPKVSAGHIVSGDKVIGDAEVRDQIVQSNRKVKAIEMEGYGFSIAALSAGHIKHLVIRGLCDYADHRKGDVWHTYASHSAASYVFHLLKDWPYAPLVQKDGKDSEGRASVTVLTTATATKLVGLATEIVSGTADAMTGRSTPAAVGAGLVIPRRRLEQAAEVVETLYGQLHDWRGELPSLMRFMDLVQTIRVGIDGVQKVYDTLSGTEQHTSGKDVVALAESIRSNALELQALLNQPIV